MQNWPKLWKCCCQSKLEKPNTENHMEPFRVYAYTLKYIKSKSKEFCLLWTYQSQFWKHAIILLSFVHILGVIIIGMRIGLLALAWRISSSPSGSGLLMSSEAPEQSLNSHRDNLSPRYQGLVLEYTILPQSKCRLLSGKDTAVRMVWLCQYPDLSPPGNLNQSLNLAVPHLLNGNSKTHQAGVSGEYVILYLKQWLPHTKCCINIFY